MFKHWRMLLAIFSPHERRRIYLLLASAALLGLLEVAGVASIMPFIAVVVDTSLIESHPYLNAVYSALGFTSHTQFQVFLGAVAFVLLIATNVFGAFEAWFTFRFCYLRSHLLCTRLLEKYLTQPYQAFLRRSTAELQKILVTEVDRVLIGTLMAGVGLFSDVVSAFFILAVLFFIDPWVTCTTLLVLGAGYGMIFWVVRQRISALGEEAVHLETEIVRSTREALDGVKEIKVLGREKDFVRRFSHPLLRASRNAVRHETLDIVPYHMIETLAFGLIIGITLFYLVTTEAPGEALAVIALYAYAAYRLVPTLKEILDGVETIRYNAPALQVVMADFDVGDTRATDPPAAALSLKSGVHMRNVSFTYAGALRPTIKNLNLEIPAGQLTCLMGPTGAGKSTLVDIMLGLLTPATGEIRIDQTPLTAQNARQWQSSIGYVPQSIYLLDDTLARNIALGLDDSEIDLERVQAAAKLAAIHDFIINDLPKGYETQLGEKGVRLSGGQRQRIGIARALYRDPQVLVLDEATNALDKETEQRILAALLDLRPSRTIVCVSHKSSVARRADRILVIMRGERVAQGSYEELAAGSSPLRDLLVET